LFIFDDVQRGAYWQDVVWFFKK